MGHKQVTVVQALHPATNILIIWKGVCGDGVKANGTIGTKILTLQMPAVSAQMFNSGCQRSRMLQWSASSAPILLLLNLTLLVKCTTYFENLTPTSPVLGMLDGSCLLQL